jgi:hypothetical protein
LGADIGIKCLKCRHSVLVERPTLERRIKAFGADRYGESLFFPNSDEWRKKNPA